MALADLCITSEPEAASGCDECCRLSARHQTGCPPSSLYFLRFVNVVCWVSILADHPGI